MERKIKIKPATKKGRDNIIPIVIFGIIYPI
jgi:hypothetical protein